MKKILILFLLIPYFTISQTKELSLRDAVIGQTSYLMPETLTELKWQDDNHFSYIKKDTLWIENVQTAEKHNILVVNDLKNSPYRNFSRLPSYKWINMNQILLEEQNTFLIYDIKTREVENFIMLETGAENIQYNILNHNAAYTIENDLYITNSNRQSIRITNDGGNGIVNGKEVHQREFGISKGIFWSPKGNFVAFYRMDESMVEDYPLVDYMAREAELKNFKYPMAGMKSHQVTVGIYNLNTESTVFLQTGLPAEKYLTNIAWAPDEKSIYLIELNREQNHMKLNQYNAETGELLKILFEEKDDKYVEPQYPIIFSKTNPEEFYYLSRKNGWFHVYKYNTSGKFLEQITEGDWEVTNILDFDPDEKYMFFEATKDSPIENHIYRININTKKIERLSSEKGVHNGILSPSGEFLLDVWNSKNIPERIDLITTSGKISRTILKSPNPIADYKLGENSIFTIRSNDNSTDLYCRMIKPANFDPLKKYPVIVYVYGGPHIQLIKNNWQNNLDLWFYYLANKGYIIFSLDPRGSLNRGKEFEQVIFRNQGIITTKDQMTGIEYLKTLPYVNDSRIGVHGWSFGGYMTLNLMLLHPETFKVGVSGGPVVDWSMYEIMYGERYMDTPEENPEGYEYTNMINHIYNLKGKLMLIHGAQDNITVMQHSMKFLAESIRQGKQVDFFVYPEHEHHVTGLEELHLREKICNYFIENL